MSETEEEIAFWKAIGQKSDDQLRRLVFADYLEEIAGDVECPRCDGARLVTYEEPVYGGTTTQSCSCDSGRVSNGRAELAEALRATADRIPRAFVGAAFSWNRLRIGPEEMNRTDRENKASNITESLFARLSDGTPGDGLIAYWRDYPTAESALRDLCRAYTTAKIAKCARAEGVA